MKINIYKKWILIFFLVSTSLILFNFIIDSNGYFQLIKINGINANKYEIISEYATKLYYARCAKPAALMLGTSRMMVFKPSDVEHYINMKTYNLSLSGSNVYEQFNYFNYMVKNYDIKYVILSLDFFSYSPENKDKIGFNERRFKHGFLLSDFKDALFGLQSLKSSVDAVRNNIAGKCAQINWTEGYSTWCEKEKAVQEYGDVIIERDMKNSLKVFSTDPLGYNSEAFKNPDSINDNLLLLKRIVNTCKERGITLKLYISPIYKNQFDLIYAMGLGDTYEKWKYEIAQIADYYDFTGRNSVTSDKSLWWDTSHLKAQYGKYIFARIFGDNKTTVPEDFGILITKENAAENITKLNTQVKSTDVKEILLLNDDYDN
ncbi:hypothetical protein [Candidatus Magnetomonas plexicatena]|uniref:hypothetical protein n=1 Tax=Candidatus Magnetomonas plexicatena TaxID=2552947 RepID=UPI0011044639|nr:hypothetical protein E2O03_004870 [Nitrospirales bacterium LBB_01]